jgi:regulatory protein
MKNDRQYTITALTVQKKKPWQTSIFVNGEFWRSCNNESIHELRLVENMNFDVDGFSALDERLNEKRAFDRAVLLLSYRARSSSELSGRLKQAGFAEEIVERTVDKLKSLNYIDDSAFSASWASSRITTKLYGSKRIRQELKEKGVADDIIAGVLSEIDDKDEEFERAKVLAKGKLQKLSSADSKADFRRLSQFLIRRGYAGSIAYKVCKDLIYSEHPDDIEDDFQ